MCFVVLYGCETCFCHFEGGAQVESVGKQGSEEDILNQEGRGNKPMEKTA